MMTQPPFLISGDGLAIVSPASIINPDYVKGAVERLESWPLGVSVSLHCLGESGVYSGTVDERTDDFRNALHTPEVKAILCSRGGYGTVHLLDRLADDVARNPKWIIGFSDISALHALCVSRGIMSLHAPMCKHLTAEPADDRCTQYLRQILFGQIPEYHEKTHPLNRQGEGRGMLVGGNLAVLCGLIGTPYDIFRPGSVLFIEDIAEAPYKIERMLYQLKLAGRLASLSGLIVGRFTEYTENEGLGGTLYELIYRLVEEYDYPVCFDFPVGHVSDNLPLIEGAEVFFSVGKESVDLSFCIK